MVISNIKRKSKTKSPTLLPREKQDGVVYLKSAFSVKNDVYVWSDNIHVKLLFIVWLNIFICRAYMAYEPICFMFIQRHNTTKLR